MHELAGAVRVGAERDPAPEFVFDNEKWAHEVDIAPFRIAKAPVTNAEFAAFVDDGGYRRREFWSAAGWAWRERVAAEKPVYWLKNDGGSWTWRRYDKAEQLPPHASVTSCAMRSASSSTDKSERS